MEICFWLHPTDCTFLPIGTAGQASPSQFKVLVLTYKNLNDFGVHVLAGTPPLILPSLPVELQLTNLAPSAPACRGDAGDEQKQGFCSNGTSPVEFLFP